MLSKMLRHAAWSSQETLQDLENFKFDRKVRWLKLTKAVKRLPRNSSSLRGWGECIEATQKKHNLCISSYNEEMEGGIFRKVTVRRQYHV